MSSLAELIERTSLRITEADARILEVLMGDPVRAALESGAEISKRAGVHPASAVRLARRLGFTGYPAFRGYLQSRFIQDPPEDLESPAARIAVRLMLAGTGGVLASILESEISALHALQAALSDEDIRGAAEMLLSARRIYVYGIGHGAILTALAALRLQRSGYAAIDLAALPNMAETLVGIGPEDVLWLVSFRAAAPPLQALRRIAEAQAVKVLLLGDTSSLRLEPPASRAIIVSRGGVGQSQSLVVPMTVINAIVLDLAAIDGGRSLQNLEAFSAFRDTLPLTIPR